MLPGNTSDKTTLKGFLERIEAQYGKAERVSLMDRGVPTEETLAQMRASDPPTRYDGGRAGLRRRGLDELRCGFGFPRTRRQGALGRAARSIRLLFALRHPCLAEALVYPLGCLDAGRTAALC